MELAEIELPSVVPVELAENKLQSVVLVLERAENELPSVVVVLELAEIELLLVVSAIVGQQLVGRRSSESLQAGKQQKDAHAAAGGAGAAAEIAR